MDLTREQVIGHRIAAQQLDRAAASGRPVTDAAILDLGVQDSGRDGASWALANRGVPVASADDAGRRRRTGPGVESAGVAALLPASRAGRRDDRGLPVRRRRRGSTDDRSRQARRRLGRRAARGDRGGGEGHAAPRHRSDGEGRPVDGADRGPARRVRHRVPTLPSHPRVGVAVPDRRRVRWSGARTGHLPAGAPAHPGLAASTGRGRRRPGGRPGAPPGHPRLPAAARSGDAEPRSRVSWTPRRPWSSSTGPTTRSRCGWRGRRSGCWAMCWRPSRSSACSDPTICWSRARTAICWCRRPRTASSSGPPSGVPARCWPTARSSGAGGPGPRARSWISRSSCGSPRR